MLITAYINLALNVDRLEYQTKRTGEL